MGLRAIFGGTAAEGLLSSLNRSLQATVSAVQARCSHLYDPAGPGADHVHDRTVVVNLLQDGLYSLQFDKISAPGLIFHALQLVIQSQLLVAVISRRGGGRIPASQRRFETGSSIAARRLRGEVVFRRGFALAVFVGKFLGAGEGQLLIAGVDLAGKVMGLGGQIEDAGAGCVGEV